jgi:ABC-2 type transport system permease protein
VPIRTMPSWLQGFARHQPATCVIDTLRGLLSGGPVASVAWQALAWCLAISALGIVAAGVLFRRKTG